MANSLFKSKKITTPPTSKAAPKPAEPEPELEKQPTAPAGSLKMVSVRFTKSQWRQIKDFALDEDTSIQALIVEALAEKMARKGISLKTA